MLVFTLVAILLHGMKTSGTIIVREHTHTHTETHVELTALNNVTLLVCVCV